MKKILFCIIASSFVLTSCNLLKKQESEHTQTGNIALMKRDYYPLPDSVPTNPSEEDIAIIE